MKSCNFPKVKSLIQNLKRKIKTNKTPKNTISLLKINEPKENGTKGRSILWQKYVNVNG